VRPASGEPPPKQKPSPWGVARLTLFILRHGVGIALFIWLTLMTRGLDPGGPWVFMAGFTAVYAIVAVLAGVRLYQEERRARRRQPPE
jgi:hypothetical protein